MASFLPGVVLRVSHHRCRKEASAHGTHSTHGSHGTHGTHGTYGTHSMDLCRGSASWKLFILNVLTELMRA